MSLTNALKSLFKEPIKRRKKMPITFFFWYNAYNISLYKLNIFDSLSNALMTLVRIFPKQKLYCKLIKIVSL